MKEKSKKSVPMLEIGKRLEKLKQMKGIKTDVELARILGITNSYIHTIKYKPARKARGEFWEGIRENFTDWEPYLRQQTPEPPPFYNLNDEIPSYNDNQDEDGISFKVTTFEPTDEIFLDKVKDILRQGDAVMVKSIKAVITNYHLQLEDKNRIKELEKENKELKKNKNSS